VRVQQCDPAGAILNLKVSKNGGLFRCKRIAAIAAAAGGSARALNRPR
jgi:L-alanine-DL-glutamate epimerase-like enolase superfamily enzyme